MTMKKVNKMHKELGLGKWSDLRRDLLKNPETKRVYDEIKLERTLRELVMDARTKKGITQKKLAEKMKTTQSVISRFEAGKVSSSIDFVQRFVDALGMKLLVVSK